MLILTKCFKIIHTIGSHLSYAFDNDFMQINANPNNNNMSFQNYKMPNVSVLFDGSTLSLEIFELVVVTMRILFECFVVC